ncbi:MAG: hypothetical protein H6513_09070 [Acidimicrobiaceae bacterium]|nr:hypothetical protein [Ilumatobacter sp.]MCB9380826.1 hypothetical protein [Acidimicrobiaceae bacterium]MCO5329895.1 hypothetical protein [Ilumatobacteraceae bacterium]
MRGAGRAITGLFGAVMVLITGCSADSTVTVVRDADDVQVMSPEQVLQQRLPAVTTTVPGASDSSVPAGAGQPPATTAAADTIPLNQDDRPPEVRLFAAFGEFRGCLEDKGYVIEGNLLDPNNPAMQDSAYRDAVITCAARSDIVAVLQEVQATRANLTPEEVEQRNEVFVALRDCLRDKGWTVEATTSEIGLLEPTEFHDADGELDERDINQCLSEMNIG